MYIVVIIFVVVIILELNNVLYVFCLWAANNVSNILLLITLDKYSTFKHC